MPAARSRCGSASSTATAGIPTSPQRERAAACRRSNLLGQLRRHHDEAGLVTVAASTSRATCSRQVPPRDRRRADPGRLRAGADQRLADHTVPGRLAAAAAADPRRAGSRAAGADRYQTTASYDALNRVKRLQFSAGRRRHGGASCSPTYNRAGGLEQVRLDDTLYVERIAYDAKGQRTLIAYGNGVMTRYAYDPQTFRLDRLRSERYTKPDDLTYRPTGRGAAGLRLRLRPGRQHPRHPRPHAGQRHPQQPGSAERRRSGPGATAGQRQRARPPLRLRPDLPPAVGHRPGVRPPPDGPTLGATVPRGTDLTRPAPTPRPTATTPWATARARSPQRPGGFTREFTVDAGQQPAAADEGRRQPLRLHLRRQRQHASRDDLAPLRLDHADQMKAFRTQTGRRRTLGARPLPLRRDRPAGEETRPQARRAGRGHPLPRRRVRASPLGQARGRREQPRARDGRPAAHRAYSHRNRSSGRGYRGRATRPGHGRGSCVRKCLPRRPG